MDSSEKGSTQEDRWQLVPAVMTTEMRCAGQNAAQAAPAVSPIEQVQAELARAKAKFPTWPTDPLHALAVLGEEFGELTKAMLQFTYEPHKKVTRQDIREEAIQTAAMALRLVESLSLYDYAPSAQHKQSTAQPLPLEAKHD